MCARLTEAQVVCEWVCDVRACMPCVAGAGCTTPAVMAAVQGLVLVRETCMCYSCRRDELMRRGGGFARVERMPRLRPRHSPARKGAFARDAQTKAAADCDRR